MVGSQLKEKQVEEAKAVLRLLPFFGTSLIYLLVLAQGTTFFIKQSTTMDRRIFSGYQIPATTIQSLIGLTTFISILTYDRILVPVARTLTGNPSGITMLQRIGTGMFLSMSSMVVAGLVEMKRLRTAREAGLIDLPMAMVPMSAWWMVPQTILIDVANVFAMVGLQEFVYGQVPSGLQSIALSLFSIFLGLGNFLSGLLIFMVDKLSKQRGGASWLADNLNRAHLDYFYMLLAAFSVLALGVFMALARCYVYREGRS